MLPLYDYQIFLHIMLSTFIEFISYIDNKRMISYTLNVTGMKITQANIRNGSQGENGDILVMLSKSKSAKGDERPPKIGFGGKITKDDLTGPLKGKGLSDLISLMSKGNAYANIQTEKYPKGADTSSDCFF